MSSISRTCKAVLLRASKNVLARAAWVSDTWHRCLSWHRWLLGVSEDGWVLLGQFMLVRLLATSLSENLGQYQSCAPTWDNTKVVPLFGAFVIQNKQEPPSGTRGSLFDLDSSCACRTPSFCTFLPSPTSPSHEATNFLQNPHTTTDDVTHACLPVIPTPSSTPECDVALWLSSSTPVVAQSFKRSLSAGIDRCPERVFFRVYVYTTSAWDRSDPADAKCGHAVRSDAWDRLHDDPTAKGLRWFGTNLQARPRNQIWGHDWPAASASNVLKKTTHGCNGGSLSFCL